MSNFKNLQQKQERINKAVEKLVDYFGNEVSMNAFYRDQSQAQIEIMSMVQFVEMHIRQGIKSEAENVFCPNTGGRLSFNGERHHQDASAVCRHSRGGVVCQRLRFEKTSKASKAATRY